jgi:hypothetical protein
MIRRMTSQALSPQSIKSGVTAILGGVGALDFVSAIQLLHELFEAAHSIVLRTAFTISLATSWLGATTHAPPRSTASRGIP